MPDLADAHMVYRGSQEVLEAWRVVGGRRELVWTHPKHFVQFAPNELFAEIRRRFGDAWKTIEQYPYDSVYVQGSAEFLFDGLQNVRTLPAVELHKHVKSVSAMFQKCSSLQTVPPLDLGGSTWTLDASHMFFGCSSLQTIPLLNTRMVETMESMFVGCSSLQTIPPLDTEVAENMKWMFSSCSKLQTIPLLNTRRVKTMEFMFSGCSSLQTIPLLNTERVKNMKGMFQKCSSLQTIPPLEMFHVQDASYMFFNCGKLQTLPPLNCRNVETFKHTFYGCTQLESFELRKAAVGFDFSMTKVGVAAAQKILNSLGTPEGAQTIKAPATARGVDTSGAVAKGWQVVFP